LALKQAFVGLVLARRQPGLVLVAGGDPAACPQPEEINMTKTQSAARDTARKPSRRTRKPSAEASAATAVPAKPPKSKVPTKADLIVVLMRRPEGVTAAQLGEATGWQVHSVRGFVAGSVKKKLGLVVATEKVDGQTIYRIVDKAPA
jgi:hypothetical protein